MKDVCLKFLHHQHMWYNENSLPQLCHIKTVFDDVDHTFMHPYFAVNREK